MNQMLLTLVLGALAAMPPADRPPECGSLAADQRRTADRILATEYLYDCCDDTVANCLEAEPASRLAEWIADDICRRVAAGHDEQRIRRALSRRARSMMGSGNLAEIDAAEDSIFGPSEAPVTVAIYACARCPYCSELVPHLYDAVDGGELSGDARLTFRIFPIRGHEGSTEAGLGFAAAAAMGRFWPFMLYAYSRFGDYAAHLQPQWAEEVGLDRERFTATVHDPATREAVVASKKEGLVNGVEETPTIFLNGRKWVGELELDELVSAIHEEAARVRGNLCASQ